MKKYLLIFLIGFLFLMPGAKAECNNLYADMLPGNLWYRSDAVPPILVPSLNSKSTYNLTLSPGTYTFFTTLDNEVLDTFLLSDIRVGFYVDNSLKYFTDLSNSYTFTVNSDSIFNFRFEGISGYRLSDSDVSIYQTYQFWLVEGETICSNEPEPEEPIIPDNPDDSPSVEETDQAKILQNFYTLFLDRLKFINDYAINNYLFLAFIGIFLVFVILEIFLYLYNRGGYK